MAHKVLIYVDTSDLERVAKNMKLSADIIPQVAKESLNEVGISHVISLRHVTPRSTRDDPRYGGGHLRNSYFLGLGAGSIIVTTNDATKWNLVNRDTAPHVIRPVYKKALSWPGMTGPREPWWPPSPGYTVSPVSNFRGWTHPGHTSLKLIEKADADYGVMDQVIMQATADTVMKAAVHGHYAPGTVKAERARARAETIPGMYGGA